MEISAQHLVVILSFLLLAASVISLAVFVHKFELTDKSQIKKLINIYFYY